MGLPPIARSVPRGNGHKLIPIRAVRVEAVAGHDPAAISLYFDSEIALYRVRLDDINAIKLSSEAMSLVAEKMLKQLVKGT